ncbi:MAG TPA: DUF3179 domain-containing (seleno)protein [Candidatus Kapabacteria bacterium]|nr:DUF3179 domain-containing (seleno)protein [Candidatus Kapabacteria bacterium]
MVTLPFARYHRLMFWIGLFLLIVPSVGHNYLISPAPGSQGLNWMGVAYYLDKVLPYLLVIGVLLIAGRVVTVLQRGGWWKRIGITVLVIFLGFLNYVMNIMGDAGHYFREMGTRTLADSAHNNVPLDWMVVSVEKNGEAHAYPVNLIAYHHRVPDTVGGVPVWVTYCSLCRTGVVFNPIVDGVYQQFRLVGIQHYNAIFQDRETGSWWYQATGLAVYGPQKGKQLQEIPSDQMTLRAFFQAHPRGLVLQRDTVFNWAYNTIARFDTTMTYEDDDDEAETAKGSGKAGAAKAKDTVEHFAIDTWVAGVEAGGQARAYEWADLEAKGVLNDQLGQIPIAVAYDRPSRELHAWKRTVNGRTVQFAPDSSGDGVRDVAGGSLWNWAGRCVQGADSGRRLEALPVRNMYWHAWKTFHPKTTTWDRH